MVELQDFRDLGDALIDLGCAQPFGMQRIGEVFSDIQAGVEGIELKGHGDVALARGKVVHTR